MCECYDFIVRWLPDTAVESATRRLSNACGDAHSRSSNALSRPSTKLCTLSHDAMFQARLLLPHSFCEESTWLNPGRNIFDLRSFPAGIQLSRGSIGRSILLLHRYAVLGRAGETEVMYCHYLRL